MSFDSLLQQLGWRPHFSQQLTLDDLATGYPARVSTIHRTGPCILTEQGELAVTLRNSISLAPVVGDWLLIERDTARASRLLDRYSLLERVAAGSETHSQPIAANLDTLFIVTACDADFSPSRLERYLAIALHSRLQPVILITKADICANADEYLHAARAVALDAPCIALDATSAEGVQVLQPWLTAGQTVAFVGSSGVGKSTLTNSLTGRALQTTNAVRLSDSAGQHTTTARQLIVLPGGACIIDTPGMRELKIGAVEAGVQASFPEIEALARACRFRDCRHGDDVGCAIRAAIASGELDARRLESYLKLQREAARAKQTMHERRAVERQFGRMVKAITKEKSKRKR